MADVTLKYKGATISELSESGSKTIETAGKYCEADILLEYVKPQGGGVSSANLLKDVAITRGFINTGGGINSQNADSLEITSDYIDVSEHLGGQIWFACLTAYATSYGSPWCACCFYDENHSKVGDRSNIQPNAARIFPCGWVWNIPASGVKYCRLSTRSYGRCAIFASFDPPVNYIYDNIFVGYTQT